MFLFSRNTAVIWPSDQSIYILKRRRNWLGKNLYYQSCVYTDMRDVEWLNRPEKIEKIMKELVCHYGLEGYGITFVLGGEQLIWKKLSLPSKRKEEALQMALWEELEGIDSHEYIIDVNPVKRANKDGTLDWMLAAYREEAIRAFYRGVETAGAIVTAMDALPAVAGRFYERETGTFYLREGNNVHCLFIQKGIPLSYGHKATLPEEAEQWMQEEHIEEWEPLCFSEQTGTLTWSVPRVTDATHSLLQQWDISYPVAILTTV